MIGETLGNYRLVAKLGSGSMGVVFLAEHQRIARRVAIKLLAPELVRDPQLLQRFFNEARATSLIRHPGIVDIYDCDVDASGRAYMVMEHLEGETLADRLRRTGKLSCASACLIAGQVADALGAVHDKGIVHRDLKPDNVFLLGDPFDPDIAAPLAAAVKVLDFGVAKLLAADSSARLTMRGMLVGTPDYMSPEQCGASETVDYRADIYALGCVLYEILSGQPPFVAPDIQQLMVAHRFRPPPPLAVSAAEAPSWLRDLVAAMLSKEPEQRPASMRQVSEVLRERRTSAPAASPTIAGRAAIALEVEREEPRKVVPPTRARSVRRRGMRWAETAIAIGTVFVLTAVVWATHRSPAFERTPRKTAQTSVTRETPFLAPAPAPPAPVADAVVKPAQLVRPPPGPLPLGGPPPGTAAAAESFARGRKPARAALPARRERPAPTRTPHAVDTDGIVDL